jgi:hypothetical protein|tara:strand:+ start:247 stop:351 length:105 start_codon:yes stop_codon:yes gene_type:complete
MPSLNLKYFKKKPPAKAVVKDFIALAGFVKRSAI